MNLSIELNTYYWIKQLSKELTAESMLVVGILRYLQQGPNVGEDTGTARDYSVSVWWQLESRGTFVEAFWDSMDAWKPRELQTSTFRIICMSAVVDLNE